MPAHPPVEIVDRDMAKVLAEKTEAERLQIGWGMQRAARRMMTRLVRAERPTWSDKQIAAEVARRFAHGG